MSANELKAEDMALTTQRLETTLVQMMAQDQPDPL